MVLPSWKLAFVCGLACLVAMAQGSFLLTYQMQLEALHKLMNAEIDQRFRRNSALNGQLNEQDVLPVLAEGTIAIREANRDLVEQIGSMRPNGTDGSSECWQFVDALVYQHTLFAQLGVQDCAYGGYSQWMRDDALERFYPLAHELHRASSEVVSTVTGVLSEDNPVTDATDVESRLDGSLDHFNEVWIDGLQHLEEELERHRARTQAIREFIRDCIDRTVQQSRVDSQYVIRFAEFVCV